MLLASATLPEFTSMRLSLGLGTRWVGQDAGPWPEVFKTDTGPYARRSRVTIPARDRSEDLKPEDDDEPTSNVMATTDQLAPAPSYERRLPSPYPLAQMGVLVVPDGPPPNDARWAEWSTRQVVQAVRQSGGGALVLSTSNAAMKRYADALRAEERWTVIRQGEQGRAKTIAAFKEDEDSVLVGTRSFFQGLDVQGRSCRLVVIDRIPFASPEDPLENAIGRLLVERAVATDPQAQAANAWMLRNVPEASMVLVQGIGRLIRSQSDRGAVVLLDNRILYSGPGWRILRAAMPPFPLSRRIADVGRVLSGEIVQSLAPPAQRAMAEITF
jgi:Rad3-related DNA helicase